MSGRYELSDGTVLEGDEADICLLLDAEDPVSDRYRQDTDIGTMRAVMRWRPEAMWCEEAKTLVLPTCWDTWTERPREEADRLVRQFVGTRALWATDQLMRASSAGEKGEAKKVRTFLDWCRRTCSKTAIANVAEMWRQEVRVPPSRLNVEPTMLGTPYGVVDLDTGTLLMDVDEWGAKDWHVTKSAREAPECLMNSSIDYDERWDEFIDEIMCHDRERALYLQRALGYSLLGANPEECMFVAYGATTRNGKGTLMESVAYALGEYARAVDRDFLMEGRSAGGADEELASLEGVRLVTISEPTKGKRLDEGKVKTLTGNDTISTRHLYGTQIQFVPQCVFWLSCNSLPTVTDPTVFSSGRMRVIPFERHFGEDEQDRGLKALFRSDRGQRTIMDWLCEGFRMWRERGLDEPESVRAATAAYTSVGGSSLARFVAECCDVRTGSRMSVGDFNDAYRQFCLECDEEPMSAQRVRREFETMGVSKRVSNSERFYEGIALNELGFSKAADALFGTRTRTGTGTGDGSGRIRLS